MRGEGQDGGGRGGGPPRRHHRNYGGGDQPQDLREKIKRERQYGHVSSALAYGNLQYLVIVMTFCIFFCGDVSYRERYLYIILVNYIMDGMFLLSR